jgi:hypothetical protein
MIKDLTPKRVIYRLKRNKLWRDDLDVRFSENLEGYIRIATKELGGKFGWKYAKALQKLFKDKDNIVNIGCLHIKVFHVENYLENSLTSPRI